MKSLRFIHVADLHLDTAFSAIANDDKEQLAKRMQDAPFEALQNLLQLCRTLYPDFIIFAGDIYNNEEASLRARFALRDAFEELQKMDIPVYYAHGNHDPLNDEAKIEFASIVWPQNVYSFGENWEYFSFPPKDNSSTEQEGYEEIARIYGISHTNKQESKNLTSSLEIEPTTSVKIGVLHTSLMGSQKASQKNSKKGSQKIDKSKYNYAPCTISDLQEKGMNYWALGHIHDSSIIAENPLIAYSGSMQGLNITEEGAHGCMFVRFENIKDKHISNPKHSFHTLAPVEWHILDIELYPQKDISEAGNILELQTLITKYIDAYVKDLELGPECTDLIFRIRLHGRSSLANSLHENEIQNDLCHALQKIKSVPRIFIKDIKSFVRPIFDFESALDRDDILGEILRVTQELRNQEALLIQIEKEVAEPLKTKILRYTTNIHERNKDNVVQVENAVNNLAMLTYKAEEICVEAFEPQQ